jgi:hypothetical protein
MPRNGSGTYVRPQANYVAGTLIQATAVNSDLNDMASALTASLPRDGQAAPTANLPMSGFRHTGAGNGVAATDYATFGQLQNRTNVSLKDFGAVGDGTTNDTAAVNTAEALPSGVIAVPAGRYSTTLTAYQATNQTYTGPGKLIMSGYAQAPKRSFVTTELTPANVDNRTQMFDGNWTDKAHTASYKFVGGSATGTPTSTYKNFYELSSEVAVYDFAAGFSTAYLGNTGRSGAFLRAELVGHGGQGDLTGRTFFGAVSANNPNALHWLDQPAIAADNGVITINSPAGSGAYLQREEFIMSDGGFPASAVYQVCNFERNNASTPLENVWLFSRPHSRGTYPIDGFYTPAGKSKRGLDFIAADFGADKAAVITKPNDRWYLNGSSTPDSIGAVFISKTLGGEWITYNSSTSLIEVAVKGRPALVVGAASTSAVSWVEVYSRDTGQGVAISAGSSDANCPIIYCAKGSSVHQFRTGGFGPVQFQVGHVPSATNFIEVRGSNGGAPAIVTNAGDLVLAPGGGGRVQFGTHTAGSLAVTGSIEIRDAGGTIRRVLVG